jgi:hypothetical protein
MAASDGSSGTTTICFHFASPLNALFFLPFLSHVNGGCGVLPVGKFLLLLIHVDNLRAMCKLRCGSREVLEQCSGCRVVLKATERHAVMLQAKAFPVRHA